MSNITNSDEIFIAKTLKGLEDVLREELLKLGARDIQMMTRAVRFKGDLGFLYKANICIGSAVRILRPIKFVEVHRSEDLLVAAQKIPWEKWFHPDKTFAVYASGTHPKFDHTGYAALVLKDGIVDRFRSKIGKRPSVDREFPQIRIELHLNKRHCTISFDSSGDSLHRRGYRKEMTIAPISEVLANGLIRLTGYRGDRPLYDPMCGSGTFPIEASIIADHVPAGIYRDSFGFMNWLDYDKELHALIHSSALKKISESQFNKYTSLCGLPDPDLLIRTGGEYRISNFLLWNISYSELYFTDELWPDFDENSFKKVINAYDKRKRNYGKI